MRAPLSSGQARTATVSASSRSTARMVSSMPPRTDTPEMAEKKEASPVRQAPTTESPW